MTTDEPTGALIPIEVREVDFYGDRIAGALVRVGDEPQIYVPIRPLCEYLGLDWSSQRQRTMRDEVLAEGVVIITIPSEGGPQRMICLPLDLLPGWLFGISVARVKDEHKAKITRYRRECFRVLWNAFKHEILPLAELAPTPAQSGAAMAYELATAVANLAREQMEAEQRLGTRIDNMARWARRVDQQFSETDQRIAVLELRLDPHQLIDDSQATELADAVKAVADAFARRGVVNAYQRVYNELYRRYSVSSYKRMPRNRYDQALEWLRAWLGEIESADEQ